MKIGIFSDIHANGDALAAVLKHLKKVERVDQYVCLGDLVGYGAMPRKCLGKVRKLTSSVLAGNHDHAAAGIADMKKFNHWAVLATDWTVRQLKPKEKQYLADLPLSQVIENALFVHSTPDHPDQWGYVLSNEQAGMAFGTFTEKICFIGHSHNPVAFRNVGGGVETVPVSGDIALQEGSRYIINVGSVGQPRDKNPKACFAVYDTTEGTVRIVRLAYDIDKAQKRILKAGLPDYLAERLAKGK